MKSIQRFVIMIALIMAAGMTSSYAQIIVNVRPPRPHYVRTAPPSPRHVWVDEEWRERNGRYEWAGGYWAAPPRPMAVWVPGHWAARPRGEIWVPGHWR